MWKSSKGVTPHWLPLFRYLVPFTTPILGMEHWAIKPSSIPQFYLVLPRKSKNNITGSPLHFSQLSHLCCGSSLRTNMMIESMTSWQTHRWAMHVEIQVRQVLPTLLFSSFSKTSKCVILNPQSKPWKRKVEVWFPEIKLVSSSYGGKSFFRRSPRRY